MSVNLSMLAGAGAQFLDNNGNPLTGGKLYSYAAGTTTPQTTYTTSAGNVAHANPIVLDSAGRVPNGGEIWLTDAVSYKFVVNTSTDVLIATYDNVTGNSSGVLSSLSASNGSSLVGFIQSGTGAVARTVQSKLRDAVSVKDFGAVGNGIADDTIAIQAAVSAASAVVFPTGTYLISSDITLPSNITLIGNSSESVVIKSATYKSLLSQGGTSPSNGNQIFASGIKFSAVSITYKDYVKTLEIFDCYFTAGAIAGNTYNAIISDAPTVDPITKVGSAEIANCTFYDVRRAIYLFRGFDTVNIHDNYIDTAAQNGIWVSTYTDPNDLTSCVRANVCDNTIVNVGTNATETYISAIDLYAVNAVVTGNKVRNVKNINYWEVDGIYVKAQTAVISGNEIHNGGYRTNIQTKQMGSDGGSGLNNGQIAAYAIVISDNSIYMDETSGYAGAHSGVFDTLNYAGKVFGGINVVTNNTLVCDNTIYGAGTGIYSVNSFSLWVINNVTIQNNSIVANRGAAAILWSAAGQNVTISNNKILNPTNAFSMNKFYGFYLYFDSSYFLPRGSTLSWIASNIDYDLRRIRNLSFIDNVVNVSLSVSGTVRGMSLAVSDSSMGGGDVLVDPGSFDNVVIKGNAVTALNAGAGDGYGFYAVEENDRYPNLNFDVSTNIAVNATTANFLPPTGYVQTLRMNNYRLWTDSTGKLRIKNGVPTSDTDGTVVGTQT